MMTKNVASIIALITVFLQTVIAQIDTTRREFFPLHIGDSWQYRDELNRLRIERVVGDTVIEGKTFYLLLHSLLSSGGIRRVDSLMRVQILYGGPIGGDSCGGELMRERSTYRLAEPNGSSWRVCDTFYGMPTPTPLVRFDGIFLRLIFGQVRETMDFSFGGVIETGDTLLSYGATLVRGIGIFHERYYFADAFYQLYGAIINGVQYGTIVAVDEIPATWPSGYELHQNYPNPFNATTTVRYEIPKASYVSLKVYNLVGQEVARLVDGHREAGSYQVEFDAAKLSSGVYIYVLSVGSFRASRWMTLIK